ncbi:S41 family peptidase [Fibrella aquatilis]|uniref:S41 family peptidase n=1 Tax=Fibrella aquatilis TaxID=2817059 RepID=A0A939G5D6_9BACT|nr:S41 family peptidase [Fibrella aquatilis]MBO0930108.1 S41 family peptidase [Fibrella aquatilis]
MNKLILIFLLLVLQQAKAQQQLTLSQQQEDFNIFRTSVQEMHAGLNWFITPERFKVLHDSVYNTLNENTSTELFNLKLRYCMAALKHGHDGVGMTNGEGGINFKMGTLPKSRKHMPFVLMFLDKKLYIINNCSSNKSIPNGSEIVAINGKTTAELSKEFCNYIFANGRNTTFKYQVLGTYYQFQYLLQVLYPSENYLVEIIPFGKKSKVKITVQTELPQTIANAYKEQTGKDIGAWDTFIEYKQIEPKLKLGYVKFETFAPQRVENDSVKFASLLEKMFTQIKKDGIENLIVDIRNNEGGNDTWQLATSYFRAIPKDNNQGLSFIQSDKFTQIKYVEQTEQNKQLLMVFQYNPYALIDKLPDGRFKLKPEYTEHDTKGKPLMPNAYNGKVFLLQNGLTFSAGFAFAGKMKHLIQRDNGFVKVVGEDNGDDMDAGVGSGGWSLNVVLPNSKIKVTIPVTGGGTDKPFTIPPVNFLDYKIIPTIKDKLKGIDTEIEFVKKMISAK